MTKTIQSVSIASLNESEKDLFIDKLKAKKRKKSEHSVLLIKLSYISVACALLAITVITIISTRSLRSASFKISVIMGKSKLANDMNYFAYRLSNEYGQLSLKDGDLTGQEGISLKYNYKLIDEISADLGITAAVFVRDGNNYRQISTSITDNTGIRAVDTYWGTGNAAYSSIYSGQSYTGEDVILDKNYLTVYRPIFAANGKEVIGILFVGKEMTTIEKVINSNTVKHIKKIAAIVFAILLASIAVFGFSCKFIRRNYR